MPQVSRIRPTLSSMIKTRNGDFPVADVKLLRRMSPEYPRLESMRSSLATAPAPSWTQWRLCNDFQRQVLKFSKYSMSHVDDLIECLWRACFISTLDLTKGYWQVTLINNAWPKMGFSITTDHWKPFGLQEACETFQWLMDIILQLHYSFSATYLDEAIIKSNTWQDHLHHFWEMLGEYCCAGLTANL